MDTLLQPPTESDYAELASWITSSDDCLLWAGPSVRYPHSTEELRNVLTSEGTVSLTLKNQKNELIGFGQIWSRNQETAHLGRIIINPKFRKNGYGKELICSLVREAPQRFKHDLVTLKVYRRNEQALKIYEDIGFRELTKDSNEDTLLMKRQANQAFQTTSASARRLNLAL